MSRHDGCSVLISAFFAETGARWPTLLLIFLVPTIISLPAFYCAIFLVIFRFFKIGTQKMSPKPSSPRF